MNHWTIVTALTCIAGPIAPAAGQRDVFASLVAKADATNRAGGYRATGWQHRGTLRARGAETVRVKLAGSDPVQFVGMCDGGCDNLDLDLLDASGRSVDRDAGADAFPVVGADEGGSYTVRVSMRGCDKANCAYLLRAYARS